MFPTIGFNVRKILEIVGSQVEIDKVFSLVGIFTSNRRCHLQLDKFIFVNKNWPTDPRIGCKTPFSLMHLIERCRFRGGHRGVLKSFSKG
jgi:hypothetical protein